MGTTTAHEQYRDLLSAAFILRCPVTVATETETYTDMYVVTVVDADAEAGEAFVLLSHSHDEQDAIGLTVDQVTGITGVDESHIRQAALRPSVQSAQ